MSETLEIWTLHKKIPQRGHWEPAYFQIWYGPDAANDAHASAVYLTHNHKRLGRKYKAVKYIPARAGRDSE